MNDILNKVSELIDLSLNIPVEIRPIVKAICKGYIRESNGKIPIEGIINVCNTTFVPINVGDMNFSGNERILGTTETDYDQQCNVIHKMSYVNDSNYIKLISILVHELGHVITESKPCEINSDGVYPFAKRTTTLYQNCFYEDGILKVKSGMFGYRMSDGFLESISTKIFSSPEFRQELFVEGYDLEDYVYKDERIFPSRIYDEYKACFELFDYIMDGCLFNFSCMSFNSNDDLRKFFVNNKLNVVLGHLDKSNDSLWELKSYEGKERDDLFDSLLQEYIEAKKVSLYVASVLCEKYGKSLDDPKYNELLSIYKSTLEKQKQLPIPDDFLKEKDSTFSN